ncbi:hypothetical protein AJ79_04740 [Helicocarpus griseus UAMH5409]|uniref:BTB domain transcription factor n=1 Tax=Helicocarpus griseus UAMH5409 TaxID=1447875 RepID=A0A2B7XTA1_9EURO|nr:hypothetical protein AJ79_04740 [Helicocarpus griseus UAMH5409]
MSSRTSTRQAAAKANEALYQGARAGTKKAAGGKRKGAGQEEAPKTKRGKKEDQEPTEVKEEKHQRPEKGKEEQPPEKQEEKQKEEPKEERKKEPGAVNGEAKQPEKEEKPKEEAEGAAPKKQQPTADKVAEPGTEDKPAEPTAVKETEERKELPSNVLEKGIIYFFFRGKVNVGEPESMSQVARSFIVLRPLPRDAKLGEGTIGDNENCRLLVLPKKQLPKSSRDRFMGFVEKTGTTAKAIRESFLAAEKETATRGTTHTPAATPVAEGVYAITTRDRAAHLTYHLTVPSEFSEVQKDIGLNPRGSFIASAKNPKYPGTAQLPKQPDYPEKVREEFGDLRWAPLRPEFIDTPNAQFLLIGGTHHEMGTEEAGEEVETLEHENEVRADPLNDDDTIYEDLGMDGRNYPKVATTWE